MTGEPGSDPNNTSDNAAAPSLAREADLERELQEALEYRVATNDILRVISRSAFDLASVLLTVVTSASRIVPGGDGRPLALPGWRVSLRGRPRQFSRL